MVDRGPLVVGVPPVEGRNEGVLGSEPDGPPRPPQREDDRSPVEAVPLPLVLEPHPNLVEPLLTHDINLAPCVA